MHPNLVIPEWRDNAGDRWRLLRPDFYTTLDGGQLVIDGVWIDDHGSDRRATVLADLVTLPRVEVAS